MYQKINTKPHLNTKPQTTAHLAQTMALLNMGNGELEEEIQKNLASNPALEVDEVKHCAICGGVILEGTRCRNCLNKQLQGESQFLTFVSTREQAKPFLDGDNDQYFEDGTVDTQTLPEYILRQIGVELGDNEKLVAASILTQIDEDGFVDVDVLELSSYYHVPISSVEKVKKAIQHADPIGVGSKDAQEAMLVQADELKRIRDIPELTEKIIAENYRQLLKKQYQEIARELDVTSSKVEEVALFITENLNPFPARSSWGDIRDQNKDDFVRLGEADIVLSYLDNDPQNVIVIEIFQPMNSNLILNAAYQQALKDSEKEIKMKMREDLDRASLFIKCLQQRTNTILRMMQLLVTIQEKYIREGDRYLKPITRAQIAKKLNVHESTVSRAVSSKIVQMPNRKVYPLSVFFDRSLQIRTEIKGIIEEEKEPLSDLQIMKKLEKRGISIARRTIAKYRDMEGIPPAYQRKERSS
ncbi:MAG TPA: hypothetical protein DCK95_07940 [Anaerolineaceae bacterium]|uniref:RNA polymerase sigma-54 factor n=1 Tax=Anaerolinea thermophila TaxID=167964 RepID=A0A124FN48_9CHLR|nr:MAG: RNA polymerase sigma-54 factor [Anaerolinea thermophila]HAF62241.1 hypothetical protein [Anaerolineaceae bacterium]